MDIPAQVIILGKATNLPSSHPLHGGLGSGNPPQMLFTRFRNCTCSNSLKKSIWLRCYMMDMGMTGDVCFQTSGKKNNPESLDLLESFGWVFDVLLPL